MIEYKDLNDQQTGIYDYIFSKLIEPLSHKQKLNKEYLIECIEGCAGSGKTTLTGLLVRDLLSRNFKVSIVAPTHAASSVLKNSYGVVDTDPFNAMCSNHPMFIGTIHKFLGLTLVNEYNEQVLRQKSQPKTTIGFDTVDVVFIDEASMIDDDILKCLLDQQMKDKFHIIFIGDNFQLLSVKDNKMSDCFNLSENNQVLSEITRQAKESKIIQLSTLCREKIAFYENLSDYNPDKKVNSFIDNENILKISESELLNNYLNIIDNKTDNAQNNRILSFRNDAVESYNHKIRNFLFGETTTDEYGIQYTNIEPYIKDELLVLQDSLIGENFKNSQLVKITNVKKSETRVKMPKEFQSGSVTEWIEKTFDCYIVEITDVDGLDTETELILFDDYTQKKFDHFISLLAKKYGELKKTNRQGSKTGWDAFWEIKAKYIKVKHGFSSTIHKSQGSTFENVFVDLNGIETTMNQNPSLAWRLLYVAVTRPKVKLFFIA